MDRDAWPGIVLPIAFTVVGVLNVVVTLYRPQVKVAAVRLVQRHVINPAIRGLLHVRLNPMGVMLLQTRGRRSGLPRVTPVGTGLRDGRIWVVAEHGRRAGYVRNLEADPRVRVMLTRLGSRSWHDAVATVEPADDPLARQRWIAGWNPLRWLNVAIVRFLGAELVSVRIDLEAAGRRGRAPDDAGASAVATGPLPSTPGADGQAPGSWESTTAA